MCVCVCVCVCVCPGSLVPRPFCTSACAHPHNRMRVRKRRVWGNVRWPIGAIHCRFPFYKTSDFHSTVTFTAHAQRRVGLLRMPSTKSTCSWMLVWTTRRARRRGICGVVRAFFSREERNRRERISWISPMSLKK